MKKPLNYSSHCYFCQSAQYLRSSRRFVQRIGPTLKKTNRRWGLGMVVPTEFSNANDISQTSTSLAQKNLLQEYEQKFAELPDDQKVSELEEESEVMQTDGMSRVHTWSIPSERMDSCKHENRPSLGCEGLPSSRTLCVLISWLKPYVFRDQTVSWLRIVNGINKYVIET